jgi:hypothetical protein
LVPELQDEEYGKIFEGPYSNEDIEIFSGALTNNVLKIYCLTNGGRKGGRDVERYFLS